MDDKLTQLKEIFGEISDLNAAAALLGWDQNTYMPPGAAEARGQQLATLSKLAHIKFTSLEVGKLLEDLMPWALEQNAQNDEHYDARLIIVAARDYEKATRVPPEFVAEMAQVTTRAFEAWVEAKGKSDFAIFRPHLEKVVEMNQRFVTFFPPTDHPYDVLLDNYEPGMKTAEVQAIFETLRPQQVALIKAIAERPQVDDSCLRQHFPEKDQWEFGLEVARAVGYDFNRGRQDKSPHPFTTSFGSDDVRITTRVDEHFFNTMFFGTLHETGHALYEQGMHRYIKRTPLEGGASLAIHESQSRLWENLVGRSRPFWEHFYPKLQQRFSSQLGNVSLDTFYKAINKVQPSLIRVEADEATYNLHIMLRLELEIAMLEGTVAIKDLPEIWNAKMQDYLGVTPPNDAKGVLQDVHWSNGMMGYFSTYALGNLISAQLWERFKQFVPELEDQIRQAEFTPLLSWLRVKIHQL
ncbi:MAG: carboxypeptidase M32, partial [Anaerolineales bacterium]